MEENFEENVVVKKCLVLLLSGLLFSFSALAEESAEAAKEKEKQAAERVGNQDVAVPDEIGVNQADHQQPENAPVVDATKGPPGGLGPIRHQDEPGAEEPLPMPIEAFWSQRRFRCVPKQPQPPMQRPRWSPEVLPSVNRRRLRRGEHQSN